jgi:hypothetical protein
MSRRRYTAAEEAEILNADADGLRELAERYGTVERSMFSKRAKLRSDLSRREAIAARQALRDAPVRAEYQRPRRDDGPVRDPMSRFARPSWFTEDLRGMTKGAV